MGKKLGLIGYPIGHSLSPQLFREYFSSRPDILNEYSYGLVEKRTFGEAYKVFEESLYACNVTAPFKEEAFAAAEHRSYRAGRCGATNLLVKEPEGITAYNTDFKAVEKLLSDNLPKGAKVVVAGIGGAGKAAVAAALECGMKVQVINRTVNHIETFAAELDRFNPHYLDNIDTYLPLKFLPDAIYDAEAVIYTLPASVISQQMLSELLPALKGKIIIEAVYHQPALADAHCLKYISGLEWLRLQAVETYRIVINGF